MSEGLVIQNASYSAAEATRLLRVSTPTLKRMSATGDIPYFKTNLEGQELTSAACGVSPRGRRGVP